MAIDIVRCLDNGRTNTDLQLELFQGCSQNVTGKAFGITVCKETVDLLHLLRLIIFRKRETLIAFWAMMVCQWEASVDAQFRKEKLVELRHEFLALSLSHGAGCQGVFEGLPHHCLETLACQSSRYPIITNLISQLINLVTEYLNLFIHDAVQCLVDSDNLDCLMRFHTFDGNKGPTRVNDLDISWVGFLGGISPLAVDPNKVHQSP
jgi:hypothetical protein